MIQMETKLNITDNTGAKTGKVIQVWKKNKGSAPLASSIVRLSIQTLKSRDQKQFINKGASNKSKTADQGSGSSITKGALALGVVVRTNRNVFRKNHIRTRFFDNAVVLLDSNDKKGVDAPLKGTRIFGPVSSKLRKPNAGPNTVSVLSLASAVA